MSGAKSYEKGIDRRMFLGYAAATGLSSEVLGKDVCGNESGESGQITEEIVAGAEKLAGLDYTDKERKLMLKGLSENLESFQNLRAIDFDNSVAPALVFDPVLPGMEFSSKPVAVRRSSRAARQVPSDLEQVAFWPVTDISQLIEGRKVSVTELTKMYLQRLKRYDKELKCVVTLTEELALKQAARADKEIMAGRYRGSLHGIPWGAKDLLAAEGYKTTWGAMPYKNQLLDYNATVVQRLEEAGAILIAKLTLGALAWGDVWFGGQTKNPWNTEWGSSGSSAGPAAATAAGLVVFSIGSETSGSIVSPCTVCGVTGLRPTFGRVSRHGALALNWSMDKIGPICRSAEDCALVFDAIYGPDGKDGTLVDLPFNWDAKSGIRKLKVGYLKTAFEKDRDDKEWKENDLAALDVLSGLGLNMIPIELPDYPIGSMSFILEAEVAAAFSELTLSNHDDELVRQVKDAWPNVFRQSRLIPAVEYIQANRLRTLVMQAMRELMSEIDVYVAPSLEGDNLLLTNLTGHPQVVAPNGFNKDRRPTSISFVGRLFSEANVLAVAKAYQDAAGFHLQYPELLK